jgi:hypothetical protein
MTAAGRYTRGLRIRTKCVTIEQLVAWFHRFCDDSSIFIATQAPRPVGLDTAFSVDLADGEPALAGEGVVIATWTTRDNQFKAPGMQIGQLRNMTAASKRVFEQMLIARALTQDASAPAVPSKQSWSEDSTEVGAPTFDDLAAGAAKAVATGADALASGAATPLKTPLKDLAAQAKDAKPGAKHTLIGLPAIPLRVAAPKSDGSKPAVTIAIARTETAPKLEPGARPSQPRMGPGSFVMPKIAPVGAKKGPVVITTLRPTPTATPAPVAAAPPVAAAKASSKRPVAPMAAQSATPAASGPTIAARTPPAGVPSIAAMRQTAPISSRSIREAAPVAPVASAPVREPVSLARGSSAPMQAEPAIARGSSTPMHAQVPESPVQATPTPTSLPPVKGSSSVPVVSPPAVDPAVPEHVEPVYTRTPRAATKLGSGPARMPAVTYDADLDDDIDDASLAPETTDVDPEPMAAFVKPVPAVEPSAARDQVVIAPPIADAAKEPVAATAEPARVAHQPGSVTTGWDVQPEPAQEVSPVATGWEQPSAVTTGWEAQTTPRPITATAKAPKPTSLTSGWDIPPELAANDAAASVPEAAAASAPVGSRTSIGLAVAPALARELARAKSEPTWDELAASSEVSRVTAPPVDDSKIAAQLGASPTMEHSNVAVVAPPALALDAEQAPPALALDVDQAPPLPPAPEVPTTVVDATPAIETPKPRRRRGLRVAVAAMAFVTAAAAATAVVLFGPWAFVAAEPSASPVLVAEVTPPLAEDEPRVVEATPGNPAPSLIVDGTSGAGGTPPEGTAPADPSAAVVTPAESTPPVAEPSAAAVEPAPVEPVAEPAAPIEQAAPRPPTKIAKQPARVKRVVAKPAITRAKIRPKKRKAAQCRELSCL